MPQLRIIDPHQHFWKLDAAQGYPWLTKRPLGPSVAGDLARIAHDYLIPDYRADVEGFNIVKSVHVEAIAADPVEETAWLQELSDSQGFPHGAVVRVALHQPDVERVLERQCQFKIVRGVRDILNWHKNPSLTYIDRSDLLTDPAWLAGFALLRKFNLSFDMQLYPSQMLDAAAVARRHPDMSIILNHAGMPVDRDAGGLEQWRKGMRALAACDNVTVKISGLGMVDWNWTTESILPFVLETIDFFGVDRSMFASNFPVDKIYSDFATLYRAFFEITKGFSDSEKERLFHDNAERLYRL
ncbi:MAG TPA: amidohydrolase family protein [Roseiarcus sp.]|nr:amidohydrolase family protein [Roseiarcus sp.]